MTIKFFYLIIPALAVVGCSSPHLSFDTEPLTGQKYCAIHANKLTALKGCHEAELVLKSSTSSNLQQESRVKGILKIEYKGKRDYTINQQEILNIMIDNETYPLEILTSIKNPHEVVENYNTSNFRFGIVKEVTSRKISFYLSKEIIKKILSANTVQFEVTVSDNNKQLVSDTYPIQAKLEPANISVIQEFQHKCINTVFNGNKNEKN